MKVTTSELEVMHDLSESMMHPYAALGDRDTTIAGKMFVAILFMSTGWGERRRYTISESG